MKFCEFVHPCGTQWHKRIGTICPKMASIKIHGKWFCEEHGSFVESVPYQFRLEKYGIVGA